MKIKLLLAGFALCFAVLFYSCEKDELEEELLEEEVDGDVRDRFIGEWTVSETSKLLGARNYKVDIQKSTFSASRVNLFNFYALGGDTIEANISAVLVSTITVPNQTVNGNFIDGTGEMIDDNKINFSYIVDDGNGVDSVTAVYIR